MVQSRRSRDPELFGNAFFFPDQRRITDEQARYLLPVRFPQSDLDRIDELSAKARSGTLRLRKLTKTS